MMEGQSIALVHHRLRRVTERFLNGTSSEDTSTSDDEYEGFDPVLFWSVNAFLIVGTMAICLYCCYGNTSWFTNTEQRRRQADAEYQATLREREERRKKAKIMAPEKRRRLLLASFRRHRVSMTVAEKDLVPEGSATNALPPSQDDPEASVTSMGNTGHLMLPNRESVPNCCAICLGEYEVGDQVVWSCNKECHHAFHQECILDWLIKMQPATPCPCCRQEFTDWQQIARERKIVWSGEGGAFNIRNVRF